MDSSNKPVIVGGVSAAAIIALFQSFITLGQASGWWNLSEEAADAWINFLQIAVPIVVIGLTTWWTAARTTSLEKPRDEDGTPLIRKSDGQLAKGETRSIENAIRKGL